MKENGFFLWHLDVDPCHNLWIYLEEWVCVILFWAHFLLSRWKLSFVYPTEHNHLGLFVKQTCRSQVRFCKAFHIARGNLCPQELFIYTAKLEKKNAAIPYSILEGGDHANVVAKGCSCSDWHLAVGLWLWFLLCWWQTLLGCVCW